MFPVVPTNEDSKVPENASTGRTAPTDRPEAVQRAPGQIAPDVYPPSSERNGVTEPAASADTFTVPKPAPDKPKPEDVKLEPATADSFTHYVHLADGRVLRADLSKVTEHIGNRYYENIGEDNETSAEIIGVYSR